MKPIRMIYSTNWHDITERSTKGDCVHLICLEGKGGFLYNKRPVNFGRNDILVLSHMEVVENLWATDDVQVEMLIVKLNFLYKLLPANHYGIGGGIALFQDPVIPVNDQECLIFREDLLHINKRMELSDHRFYEESLGALCLTMVYDLFDFHAKQHPSNEASDRSTDLVKQLMLMLDTGITRTERSVRYFADRLNVTPKYLSDTVKRQTGSSVIQFINQYTMSILIGLLNDPRLSITQIADVMNFSSPNYFCRYCMKHLGTTPSEYRLAHQPKK